MLAKEINRVKALQEIMATAKQEILLTVENLEKKGKNLIKAKLKELFPDVKFNVTVHAHGGCISAPMWAPICYVRDVNNLNLSYQGMWWRERGWHHEEVEPPIPTDYFLSVLEELSKEVGIKVELCNRNPNNWGYR